MMERKPIAGLVWALALGAAILLVNGTAAADAPGAARFTVVNGPVEIENSSGAHSTAAVDALVFPGEYVMTGAAARAEIQFNESTILRLAGGVQVRLTGNGDYNRHLQVADGTVEVSILRDGEGLVEIDTPSVTVRARNAGAFRITIARDGTTYVTARRGRADVVTPARTYSVDPGTTLVASGAAAHPHVSYVAETARDAFDEFNTARDAELENALSQTTSSLGYIGTSGNGYSYGQSSLFSSSCDTYAPFGSAYYGSAFWGGYGLLGGGCAGYGGLYTPFAWSSPYYGQYWPIAYWPWYPIWYPYPPYPYPPPRHRHPFPPPAHRPFPQPQMATPVAAPRIASVPPVVVHSAPIVVRAVRAPSPAIARDDSNVPVWRRADITPRTESDVPVWRRIDAAPEHDRATDASWDRFNRTRGEVVIPAANAEDGSHAIGSPVRDEPFMSLPAAVPHAGAPAGPATVGPLTGAGGGHAAGPVPSAPHVSSGASAPVHVTSSASASHGGGGRPPRS
jgi:hypothetical protein